MSLPVNRIKHKNKETKNDNNKNKQTKLQQTPKTSKQQERKRRQQIDKIDLINKQTKKKDVSSYSSVDISQYLYKRKAITAKEFIFASREFGWPYRFTEIHLVRQWFIFR